GLPGSGTVATVSSRVIPQRTEKIHPTECRPIRFGEPELRVCRLPQQKTRQPLFPGCADDEIRIGLTRGVQMLGNMIDIETCGELLNRGSLLGMMFEQFAHGMSDL